MKKMKKLRCAAMLLTVLICLSALVSPAIYAAETETGTETEPTIDYGYDVNGDGEVNPKDLTRLMKHISGNDVEVMIADINSDGTVNTKDMTRLMKYLAGGTLGTESETKKAWNRLCSYIMRDGTFENGAYVLSYDPYTEGTDLYMPVLAYSPEEKSVALMVVYTTFDETSTMFGFSEMTTVVITQESTAAEFIYMIVDAEGYLYSYAEGTFAMDTYNSTSAVDFTTYDFGDMDASEMLEYVNFVVYDSLTGLDYFLQLFSGDLSLESIGFTSLYN